MIWFPHFSSRSFFTSCGCFRREDGWEEETRTSHFLFLCSLVFREASVCCSAHFGSAELWVLFYCLPGAVALHLKVRYRLVRFSVSQHFCCGTSEDILMQYTHFTFFNASYGQSLKNNF